MFAMHSSPSIKTPYAKPIVWTIAASDSSGGAGIQADLKTCFDLGVHGCSAITALTAQNSQGVVALQTTDPAMLHSQLQALAEDLPPRAIKLGVLPDVETVTMVAQQLASLPHTFVVFDPVLSPTLGVSFVDEKTRAAFSQLFPLIDLLTPNIPEAQMLTGITITDTKTQQQAAEALLSMGLKGVLIKGGHSQNALCQDVLLLDRPVTPAGTACFWLSQKKYHTPHTHGTGCTLSSAIAAFVARGKPLKDAVVLANAYIVKGIKTATGLEAAGEKPGAVAQTGWPDSFIDFPQISLTPEAINRCPMPACDSMRLGLYPVVDSLEWLQKLLPLGVKTIQLRIKEVPADELDSIIAKAVQFGRDYDARLFINDYWELAIKHKAYGVHLGQEDMASADVDAIRCAGLHLGISTHGEYEFSYAATFKPSYLAIGAIFPTDTKEVIEVGLDNLYHWAWILRDHYPLVAIGGINKHNIQPVLKSGVGSVAVVSAITKANDYRASVIELTRVVSDRCVDTVSEIKPVI
jgi:hydroxymethylpyrimidine kinase/phosphomethylpyrimidine kinase/thiamine-phosphate diphosphorylase